MHIIERFKNTFYYGSVLNNELRLLLRMTGFILQSVHFNLYGPFFVMSFADA